MYALQCGHNGWCTNTACIQDDQACMCWNIQQLMLAMPTTVRETCCQHCALLPPMPQRLPAPSRAALCDLPSFTEPPTKGHARILFGAHKVLGGPSRHMQHHLVAPHRGGHAGIALEVATPIDREDQQHF